MLSYITTPYSEELLYSVISRYKHQMRLTAAQANMDFFGSETAPGTPLLLGKFQKVAEAYNHAYGSKFLIDLHTPYKYFSLFRTRKEREHQFQTLLDGSGIYINDKRLDKNLYDLRYCSECVEVDIELEGEPYFHVEHCLPGILTCPYHNTFLQRYFLENTWQKEYYRLEESVIRTRRKITLAGKENYAILGKLGHELLHTDIEKHSLETIAPKYAYLLNKRGYLTSQGRIKHGLLEEDMLKRYSGGNSAFHVTMSIQNKTDLFRNYGSVLLENPRMPLTSVEHLLLIGFLADSIEDFLDTDDLYIEKVKPKIYTSNSARITECRKEIAEAITLNPMFSRTNLRKQHNAAYAYLQSRDRIWFEKHMPATGVQENAGKLSKRQAEDDDTLLAELQEAFVEIQNANEVIRICKESLLKRIDGQPGHCNFNGLPKAKAYIESVTESAEAVMKRRFIKGINNLDEGTKVTVNNIRKKAKLKNSVQFEQIKDWATDYVSNYYAKGQQECYLTSPTLTPKS